MYVLNCGAFVLFYTSSHMWNVQNEQKEIEEDNALLYEQWKAAREQLEEQITENRELQSVQSHLSTVFKMICANGMNCHRHYSSVMVLMSF